MRAEHETGLTRGAGDPLLAHLGLRADVATFVALGHVAEDLARAWQLSADALCARAVGEPITSELCLAFAQRLSVPESTFFRHPAHFEVLEKRIITELRARRGGPLRLLSAGSARGEEPYSLAISLERAWPGPSHRVLAVDVSQRSSEAAVQGRFRDWSFRGVDLPALAQWISPREPGWVVAERLRAAVEFIQGNLLALPPQVVGAAPFDVIFCRNVLIYFSPEAGRRLVQQLAGLLAPDGYLFVGPADHDFCGELSPEQLEGNYLYRAATPRARPAQLLPEPEPLLVPAPEPVPGQAGGSPPPAPRAEVAPRAYAPLLAQGQALRDEGRYEEAFQRFDEAVSGHPARPEAYFEQALLLAEKGLTAAARELLQRALYLDACFSPALLVLAKIYLREGQPQRAHAALTQLDASLHELDPVAMVAGWPEMSAGALKRVCRQLLDRAQPGSLA